MASLLDGLDQRTRLAGHNRLELLLFRLTTPQRFGINVFKVQEVIQCPPLTRLPGSNRVIRGIASMRGRTITVIDMSMAIGGPGLDDPERHFIIITEYNRRTQGFLVGSVERIVNMNWGEIMAPPPGMAEGSYMTAVTQVDDELVEIIDVEKVLKEVIGDNAVVSDGIIDQSVFREDQNVLVVDDSSVARNQIKRVLDQLGVNSILCGDGQQALQQLHDLVERSIRVADHIGLVISDVEMPKMDGYTLTAEIRRDPELAALHVVLHSSLSGVFNEAMVERVGADRFLAKYEPDELATIVQSQLSVHRNPVLA